MLWTIHEVMCRREHVGDHDLLQLMEHKTKMSVNTCRQIIDVLFEGGAINRVKIGERVIYCSTEISVEIRRNGKNPATLSF